MFWLGVGFMLLETKAVVHMALLFGSTWIVNSVVFCTLLVMILAANLYVLRLRPTRLSPYAVLLMASLAANVLVPLGSFLGLAWPVQVALAGLLTFSPIFFAGVIFALWFRVTQQPDHALGSNVAGAMVGGLAENATMLIGFRYLIVLAAVFYALAMGASRIRGR